MKINIKPFLLTCVLIAAGVAAGADAPGAALRGAGEPRPQGAKAPLPRITAVLADGSVVKGTPLFPALVMNTSFGRQEIPLRLIASVEFSDNGLKVRFRNNDVLSGKTARKFYGLETVFGKAHLPYGQLKRMNFAPNGEAGKSGLLLSAALGSPNENLEKFGAKMEAKNVKIVEGRNGGKAMGFHTKESTAAISLPFSPYAMKEGTVEFWARFTDPYKTFSGGGGQPWFFNITSPAFDVQCHFVCGFTNNDGLGKGGFTGRRPNGGFHAGTHSFGSAPNVSATRLLGDTPGGWHHYAYIWKEDGVDFPEAKGSNLVLAIDGKVVASSGRTAAKPNLTPEFVKKMVSDNRFVIHDENSDLNYFMEMSDLKIWNLAKIPNPN